MARTLVGIGIVFFGLIGCSKDTPRTSDATSQNLQKIWQAYMLYTDWKRKTPRNDEELKSYFPEIGEQGDPDAILRSPRDGEAFEILYGPRVDSDARSVVFAHEQTGVEGRRYVLMLSGDVKEISEEEFKKAEFAKPVNRPRTQQSQ